ncbi:MAG: DNA alkylation repair protein [Bacteroidales bacterium]
MSTADLLKRIVNEVAGYQNGIISASINNLGAEYKMNYGVTIPELEMIAKPHKGNHELALALFKEDVRECKILASMIDDPSKVTGEQIDDWAQSFTNLELVEQVCSNLFWKSTYALSRSIEWCLGNDELLQRAGLIIAARSADIQEVKDVVFEPYINIIEGYDDEQVAKNKSTIAFALRQIAKRNDIFKQKAIELATKMAESSNEHQAWVGSQLLFELNGDG